MKKMIIAILAIVALFSLISTARGETRVFKGSQENPGTVEFGENQTPNACVVSHIGDDQMLATTSDLYAISYDPRQCTKSDQNFEKYASLLRYDSNGSVVIYVMNLKTGKGAFFTEQKVMDAVAVQGQITVVQQQTSAVVQQVTTVGNQFTTGQSRELAVAACKGRVNNKYRGTLKSPTNWTIANGGIDAFCKGECRKSKALTDTYAQVLRDKRDTAFMDCEVNPGPNTNPPPTANYPVDNGYTNPTSYQQTPYYPPYNYDYGYNSQPQRAPGSLSNCLSQCMQQINDGPRCHQICQ